MPELGRSTSGIQNASFGVAVVSHETVSQTMNGSSVVYVWGPAEGQLVLLRTQP